MWEENRRRQMSHLIRTGHLPVLLFSHPYYCPNTCRVPPAGPGCEAARRKTQAWPLNFVLGRHTGSRQRAAPGPRWAGASGRAVKRDVQDMRGRRANGVLRAATGILGADSRALKDSEGVCSGVRNGDWLEGRRASQAGTRSGGDSMLAWSARSPCC